MIPTKAVKGVILNQNNEILLLQRNPKTRDNANWDLPGGLIEPNEKEIDALIREIKEELDLNILIIQKSGIWNFYRPIDNQIVNVQNYLCKILEGNIKLSNEHIGYKWVPLNDIKKYPVKDKSLYKTLEKI